MSRAEFDRFARKFVSASIIGFMLNGVRFCAIAVLPWLSALAADAPPTEWVDPDTGHRVVRLSSEPGSQSLYFNDYAYTAGGEGLVITTPTGIAMVNLKTRAIQPLVEGRVHVIVAGRKTGQVYYGKPGGVYAVDVNTHATREVAKLAVRGFVSAMNADETLLAGTLTEGAGPVRRPDAGGAGGDALNKAEAKEGMLEHRLNQRIPMAIFIVDVKSGELKIIHRSTDWLNHLQFSPTDPTLLMFCHEGPWHKVDRIWTIRTDGTQLTKIHTRTMDKEIAGHEFWSHDGQTIWYDLQTPRGEDFWVAGYRVATGERTWYHLQRDQWSVHFNVSPDGSLFAGDGGDGEMVAHAKDGKWIYLFRPAFTPSFGLTNEAKGLIVTGVFQPERLVNMSRHDYKLEPNVSFTPDRKWIVFRSNMFGPTHVFAVAVDKE